MSDSNVIKILEDFSEYLSTSNIITDTLRWIIWILVRGIAVLVDGMENVTNEVLLVKEFFNNSEIQAFIVIFRPVIIILFAFSFLFTGYLLIFQRKVHGEAIGINLIICLAIFTVLTPGMTKMNHFTDAAIEGIGTSTLYNNTNPGSLSENIVTRNMKDLYAFDQGDWKSTEIKHTVPTDFVLKINPTERFNSDDLELKNSKVAENYLGWTGNGKKLNEFDQGGMADWNNEYYFRYDFNWFTIIATLLVIGFTLFTIGFKLAKLSYELAFNYVLAMIIAPTDIHDGAKTKKIIQNIINTFVVIILIFLSMHLYVVGVGFLSESLDGFAYLIALLGFSLALIDGPNIVERLYGIDAGLKSGWGVLATGIAAGKMATHLTSGIGRGASSLLPKGDVGGGKESDVNAKSKMKSPLSRGAEDVVSPFNNSNGAITNDKTASKEQTTSGQYSVGKEGSDNLSSLDSETTSNSVDTNLGTSKGQEISQTTSGQDANKPQVEAQTEVPSPTVSSSSSRPSSSIGGEQIEVPGPTVSSSSSRPSSSIGGEQIEVPSPTVSSSSSRPSSSIGGEQIEVPSPTESSSSSSSSSSIGGEQIEVPSPTESSSSSRPSSSIGGEQIEVPSPTESSSSSRPSSSIGGEQIEMGSTSAPKQSVSSRVQIQEESQNFTISNPKIITPAAGVKENVVKKMEGTNKGNLKK